MSQVESCPCGSGEHDCCLSIVRGAREAATAEELMRSRYTAFVLGDMDYLRRSWSTATCPTDLRHDPSRRWAGLEIMETERGRQLDANGVVEFRATFEDQSGPGQIHERSRFAREAGRWVYVDADID